MLNMDIFKKVCFYIGKFIMVLSIFMFPAFVFYYEQPIKGAFWLDWFFWIIELSFTICYSFYLFKSIGILDIDYSLSENDIIDLRRIKDTERCSEIKNLYIKYIKKDTKDVK